MKVNRDGLTSKVLESVENQDLRALRTTPANATQFGESLVASRTSVLELNSSYGFSRFRDIQAVTGSGSVTDGTGTIDLATGTTANSSARLEASEIGRYVPGKGGEIGVNVIIPTLPTGNQFIEWGAKDRAGDNEIIYGVDATGPYVALIRGGSQQFKVRQENWSADKLDGTGRSDITLDLTKGNIFQIDFTWYGSGEILYSVVDRLTDAYGVRTQYPIRIHSYAPNGAPSLNTPNLTPFVRVDNGGDASNISVRVGGRQYTVVGQYEPKTRLSSDFRGSVGTTTTTVIPLVSAVRKSGFADRAINLNRVQAVVTQPHVLEVRFGGALTGASFRTPTNHQADETAMEYDISATAITGGDVVAQTLADGGGGTNARLATGDLNFDLPNGDIITLCARTITGNGSIAASLLQLREEW